MFCVCGTKFTYGVRGESTPQRPTTTDRREPSIYAVCSPDRDPDVYTGRGPDARKPSYSLIPGHTLAGFQIQCRSLIVRQLLDILDIVQLVQLSPLFNG